ncbi:MULTISPECIES: COG2426 family protein [unclassified Romboutsia]|uniref:COG2426 family protein n=1 Tax=unclassified Romboutsia TaxID=2626894 RepID=UPI00082169FF|nr:MULTISPECIES: small multi-drug export protein [unclassified Romboutsia]SCH19067.1 Predicted membrane protein [uncultured Clostridium sp.]
MGYLHIMILSMIPVTELRGAIPLGIAMDLNPIGVYLASVAGSTIVSIPLVLCFRNIMHYLRTKKIFLGLIKKVDNKIESGMKKMKKASILGIILFVGVPLPTTGTWTASAIASILKMRMKEALAGVLIGNMMAGVIVTMLSLHII